jgi:hypothetical protein
VSAKEIAEELQHYLKMYSISQDQEYLTGILTYAAIRRKSLTNVTNTPPASAEGSPEGICTLTITATRT